ncbi:MAG: 1,2-phenylacetyl-CoA epoxidase subunit PaaC [Nitriliruptorales bacterium]|nr:1,2-phenylacetyl-CoA epoxidase subunit PaaC [Nitriliruptorales bacterium]
MSTDSPTRADEVELPDLGDLRTVLVLTLADDELVTGHRHSHWTGVAPSLEEDLAFSTIAQDEINHADVWYQLLVDDNGDRAAVDEVGLGRQPDQYRHAVLCERPPGDFAYTLARHWCYDHFDDIRLDVLTGSDDKEIAAVATKLRHEERYHLEHADHWFRRLVRGGDEARGRLGKAIEEVLPEALWLFEPLPHEDSMIAEGLLPAYSGAQLVRWLETIAPALEEAGFGDALPADLTGWERDDWQVPEGTFSEQRGRYGNHTDDFLEDVWPEMTALYRAHPGASW